MRISLFVLAFAAAMVIFSSPSFAITTGSCSDGTPYGQCSTVTPGDWCHGTLATPTLDLFITQCPCEAVQGYTQQGTGDSATCVQAKCDDGTKMGECSQTQGANYKKVCVGGSTFTDNATKCGCPDPVKQQVSPSGLVCIYNPCSDGTKDNMCSSVTSGKKCTQGNLVDSASTCPCKQGYTKQGEACVLECTDGTVAGQCSTTQPKFCSDTGYLLDNSGKCGCPSGQAADASGTRCVNSILGVGGSDILGGGSPSGSGANASGTSNGTSAGGLQCCCLPTALIGLAGGFVFFRRRK